MIDFVGKRYWYFLISLLVIIPGIISLLTPPGLKLSVDFTGGTLWEMRFEREVQLADVRAVLAETGLSDAIVQTSGERQILVRAREVDAEAQAGGREAIESALRDRFGELETLRFESVGPALGNEVGQKAMLAVALASVGILAYISMAFRKIPGSFRYGTCAVIALLHDAFVVLGVFSILGKLFDVEVDALFVTAVLTVIGFSVHDTIVVFDRIRENLSRHAGESFAAIVNHSILQTLTRSLNTSLTTMLVLAALALFGGVTIRNFALALLIGIFSGAYSSIFNASQLLVAWEEGDIGRFLGRISSRPQPAAGTARR
ncbi:MAG: protein translocase subunit SecF [Chloroflexota bacterium]